MSNRRLLVKVPEQIAELWVGNVLAKTYVVSTAANGLSCEDGSNCTPTGKFRVEHKIGEGLPLGAILKSRVPTGEIWSPISNNPLFESSDLVLTRVLWLSGAEPHNLNTLNRFIYLHGTNQEKLLGTPASHGCVRFSNLDIIQLFDLLDVGDLVEILDSGT